MKRQIHKYPYMPPLPPQFTVSTSYRFLCQNTSSCNGQCFHFKGHQSSTVTPKSPSSHNTLSALPRSGDTTPTLQAGAFQGQLVRSSSMKEAASISHPTALLSASASSRHLNIIKGKDWVEGSVCSALFLLHTCIWSVRKWLYVVGSPSIGHHIDSHRNRCSYLLIMVRRHLHNEMILYPKRGFGENIWLVLL